MEEAEAESFVASGTGAVPTAEVVEDVRQKPGVDAHAVVGGGPDESARVLLTPAT